MLNLVLSMELSDRLNESRAGSEVLGHRSWLAHALGVCLCTSVPAPTFSGILLVTAIGCGGNV